MLDAKKATDVVLLDVSQLLWITDVFAIASGTSNRNVQSLADEVEFKLRDIERRPLRVEGRNEAEWVLLDYGDVVVHIFQPTVREYFSLERLWGDAPLIEWEPAATEA